ncbi:MAG: hypothetical protein RI931_614 [Actinomycetota bacterium]|jgi:hypothetical protein
MQKSTQRMLITSGALLLSSGMVAAGAFIAAIDSVSAASDYSRAGIEPTVILKGGPNQAEPMTTMVSPTARPATEQPQLTEDVQASLVGSPCLVNDLGAGTYAWFESTQNTDLYDVYFMACLVPKK